MILVSSAHHVRALAACRRCQVTKELNTGRDHHDLAGTRRVVSVAPDRHNTRAGPTRPRPHRGRLLPLPGGERRRAAGPLGRRRPPRTRLPEQPAHRPGDLRAFIRPLHRPPRPDRPGKARPRPAALPLGGGDLRRPPGAGARSHRRTPRRAPGRSQIPGPPPGPVL